MIVFILLKRSLEIVTQVPQEFLPFSNQILHQIFFYVKSHIVLGFSALAYKLNLMCPSRDNICRDILCTISIAMKEVNIVTGVKLACVSFKCS